MTTSLNLVKAIETDGGFTFDPADDALVVIGEATGYAVARPGTERVVGTQGITREAFAEAVADLLIEHAAAFCTGAVLGGWYSPERGVYLVELTDVLRVDRAEAVRVGTERHQEGILDLATGEYIPTGGRGDA
jgi:hypothetical protein